MNDCVRCAFDCLESLLDDVLTRLCQNLYSHIIRNHITLDQSTHEDELRLGCCRESDLDLLESDIHKHLEEL